VLLRRVTRIWAKVARRTVPRSFHPLASDPVPLLGTDLKQRATDGQAGLWRRTLAARSRMPTKRQVFEILTRNELLALAELVERLVGLGDVPSTVSYGGPSFVAAGDSDVIGARLRSQDGSYLGSVQLGELNGEHPRRSEPTGATPSSAEASLERRRSEARRSPLRVPPLTVRVARGTSEPITKGSIGT
jgi:hypothetical protein